MENKIDLLFKKIADDVSKDLESAREFLQEEMPSYETKRNDLVHRLNKFISSQRLIEGKASQEKLQDRLKQFFDKIKGLSLDEILARYPAIPKTAFSKLEGDKLNASEMDELLRDAAILGFLEEQSKDDVDDQSI
jgi:hypothetical protein